MEYLYVPMDELVLRQVFIDVFGRIFSMFSSIFTHNKYNLGKDSTLDIPGCASCKLSNMFSCIVFLIL